MRVIVTVALLCAGLSGCTSTGGQVPPPEPAKPEVVGKVSSQPGKCFFRDAGGKVFIDTCP